MIVSLTVVRYRRMFIPFAFLSMAVLRIPMALNRKCVFWKLMGSGRGGSFALRPDLQQWAMLAAWQSRSDFDDFRSKSFTERWWNFFCRERWTVLCTPIAAHGSWDGREPFIVEKNTEVYTGPVAVLTRATIRISRLKNFWSNVERVSNAMNTSNGYLFSFGIGEAPFVRQATFSVWRSAADMEAFAFGSEEHRDVIRKTRREDWYSEELFARFRPEESFGSINGKDPLNEFFQYNHKY